MQFNNQISIHFNMLIHNIVPLAEFLVSFSSNNFSRFTIHIYIVSFDYIDTPVVIYI